MLPSMLPTHFYVCYILVLCTWLIYIFVSLNFLRHTCLYYVVVVYYKYYLLCCIDNMLACWYRLLLPLYANTLAASTFVYCLWDCVLGSCFASASPELDCRKVVGFRAFDKAGCWIAYSFNYITDKKTRLSTITITTVIITVQTSVCTVSLIYIFSVWVFFCLELHCISSTFLYNWFLLAFCSCYPYFG
jgi:hypothetical protein